MLNWKKKLLIFLCSLLPIALAAGFAVKQRHDNVYTVQIDIVGDPQIVLQYGQPYVEQGATATSWGSHIYKEPIPVDVQIEGSVADMSVGTFVIRYRAVSRGVEAFVDRQVQVVDNVPPTITLTEDAESYTLPGQAYSEEGFVAMDNADGDISHRVERWEENGFVHYSVSDLSGNTAVQKRQIRYNDPIPPVLTLSGDGEIAMTAGKAYVEPGYSAIDNCDGDITANVKVTGYVDGYQPGTYTVDYTVQDSYGNQVSASRRVKVVEHPVQEYVANPDKVIYLTFDDGPGPDTPYLLDILHKYNVKATFFVVNTGFVDTIRRTAQEGHTVAIHTASHRFKDIYASEDAYFQDLYAMQSVIYDLIGVQSTILRFPGGSSNTISDFNKGIMTRLTKQVKEKGFRYFDWNVDSMDSGGAKTETQVFNNVVNGIGDKEMAVVLQHDIKSFSIGAVERIINWGLENGYTFLPLDMNSPVCEHNILN